MILPLNFDDESTNLIPNLNFLNMQKRQQQKHEKKIKRNGNVEIMTIEINQNLKCIIFAKFQ